MTKVVFYKRGEDFVRIESVGHTGYAQSGEDIVCAALSALTQGALLGIRKVVGVHPSYERNEAKGILTFALPKDMSDAERHDCKVIMDTLYNSVTDIAEGYSEYIEVEVK